MNKYSLIILATIAVFMTGCRSTKGLEKDNTKKNAVESVTGATYVQQVMENAQTVQVLTSKIKADIEFNGKSLSLGGSLRMRRDDVIQLSLTFLGIEGARIEFSPQDVLIIDRLNKRYVRADYSQVDFLKRSGLNFYSLQSLFWNELFVPGQKTAAGSADKFTVSASGSHTLLSLTGFPNLNYDFLTDTQQKVLKRLMVQGKKATNKGELIWKYENFSNVFGKSFPTEMEATFKGDNRKGRLALQLSRFSNDANWEGHTTPSSKYQKVEANSLLRALINL